MNIDLIDRCLYERTCDVRWWATDSSVVDALTQNTQEAYEHASRRMGVILGAYTVYFDLVLCDLNGRTVANGRPDLYKSVGSDQSQEKWFRDAKITDIYEGTGQINRLVVARQILGYSGKDLR